MAIDDYLHAIYSWTRDGWTHEFTFAHKSMPAAPPLVIECPVTWGIVTACNPMSAPLDDAANERRDRELASLLQRAGIVRGPAAGRSADGRWREHGRVVFGVNRERMLEIARAFNQRAVIWATTSGVGILDCLDERMVTRRTYGRRFEAWAEECPKTS